MGDLDKNRRAMVCATCGSENVRRDAWAVWDTEAQDWTLGELFDAAQCEDCEAETNIEERDETPRLNEPSNSH